MMSNQETLHKIHLDENKKTYISWKSIAINQNDLNKEEKEQLGFSPPYVNQTNNDKIKGKTLLLFDEYYTLKSFLRF